MGKGKDLLLLKNDGNPKCFTRTTRDFTCFFETFDNKTYDFLYKTTRQPTKSCEMSVQRTEEGAFLHICSFPRFDIFLYSKTDIQVVERTKNKSLYNRTIYVEDQLLLDSPFNVSLDPNGRVGELQVSWHTKSTPYIKDNLMYKIIYSSKAVGNITKEVRTILREMPPHTITLLPKDATLSTTRNNIHLLLTPGEEVEVQVAVKSPDHSDAGHWSSWSQPVRAAVPQSADDISLICSTPDLQNVTCHWNASRYDTENEFKLFYKMSLGESLNRGDWSECLADWIIHDTCHFHGNVSRKMRVKLKSTSASTTRTFFTKEFTLNRSIKTPPPGHLRQVQRKDELCLEWEAPIPTLSAHLQYEVDFNVKGRERWKIGKGPETETCVKIPGGSQFSIKIRAKPTGSIYAGTWSDWSEVLTGHVALDKSMLLILYVLVPALFIFIVLIWLLCLYRRKIKRYLWPPMPDLQKVLQGFLTEINKQNWDPPMAGKQCFVETSSSVVEILSEAEVKGPGKVLEESSELLSSDESLSSEDRTDGSSATDIFPDYVTLNKDTVIVCLGGNSYVCELVEEDGKPPVEKELLQTCSCSSFINPYLGNEIVNQSYLVMAEPADRKRCEICDDRRLGNTYTNLPNN
ncbi:thrombopoietin receptor [Cololabis saira]|uniref:thrombopoietin receptor n=1 Tax=Cololabis saira TaxID=129043 RepID=UPI002AD2BD2D|nr:thrombopoietin receptor [Cololabis saira]